MHPSGVDTPRTSFGLPQCPLYPLQLCPIYIRTSATSLKISWSLFAPAESTTRSNADIGFEFLTPFELQPLWWSRARADSLAPEAECLLMWPWPVKMVNYQLPRSFATVMMLHTAAQVTDNLLGPDDKVWIWVKMKKYSFLSQAAVQSGKWKWYGRVIDVYVWSLVTAVPMMPEFNTYIPGQWPCIVCEIMKVL